MVAVLPLLAALLAAIPSSASGPPKSFGRIAQKADAARTADHIDEAIDLYTEGVRLRPSWNEGWWSLGSLFYDQDRFAEADVALRHFAASAPRPGPAYAFLGLCEYETHDYDRALRHFQAWASKGSPGTPALIDVAGFHWALLLTREGRFVEALYLLAAKAEKLGSSPALTEGMGLASLRMENLPEDYPPERREPVWLAGEAAFYSAVHDYDRAEGYVANLLKHYGSDANVHYFHGTLLSFRKERAAAADEYRQELQVSPQHVPAMIELAFLYLFDSQPEKALPLAQRAVALDPKNPRARHALGRSLLDSGRLEESVRELETARQLAPDSAPIRFTLANAYKSMGRNKEAERELAAFDSLKDKNDTLSLPQNRAISRERPEQPQ